MMTKGEFLQKLENLTVEISWLLEEYCPESNYLTMYIYPHDHQVDVSCVGDKEHTLVGEVVKW